MPLIKQTDSTNRFQLKENQCLALLCDRRPKNSPSTIDISKASGFDRIPIIVRKKSAPNLTSVLTRVFQICYGKLFVSNEF